MAIFNEKMGVSNYVILNALRRKEELRVTATAQQGGAAAAADPGGVEAELPPPPPAQIQQVDGTVSSTPSRGSSPPQEYDEFKDDLYSEDRQERVVRQPQMRPVGKADKPPAWKGSSVERWQEFTVSLQAWHIANKDFMTA